MGKFLIFRIFFEILCSLRLCIYKNATHFCKIENITDFQYSKIS